MSETYLLQIIHANINNAKHGGINQASNIIALGTELMQHILSLHRFICIQIVRVMLSIVTNVSRRINQEYETQILIEIPSNTRQITLTIKTRNTLGLTMLQKETHHTNTKSTEKIIQDRKLQETKLPDTLKFDVGSALQIRRDRQMAKTSQNTAFHHLQPTHVGVGTTGTLSSDILQTMPRNIGIIWSTTNTTIPHGKTRNFMRRTGLIWVRHERSIANLHRIQAMNSMRATNTTGFK